MFFTNKNQNTRELNKEFADFFEGMMPAVYQIKKMGHIGSGLTEFAIVYKLSSSNLPVGAKLLLIALSLLIAAFVSTIIEKGIDNFFPYFFKQLISWKFPNKWFRAMFWVVLILFIIPLAISSPTLSFYGGNEIVEDMIKEPSIPVIDSLNNRFEKEKRAVYDRQKQTVAQTNELYKSQIQAIRKKYASRKRQIEIDIRRHERLDQNKHKWAKGQIKQFEQKIEAYKIKENEAISPILFDQKRAINKIDSAAISEINYLRTSKDREISIIRERYNKGLEKRNYRATLWGGLMGYFAAFCGLVTFACIMLIELYKIGAGTEKEAKPAAAKLPSFLTNLLPKSGNYETPQSGNIQTAIIKDIVANTLDEKRQMIGFDLPSKAAKSKAANTNKSGNNRKEFAAFDPKSASKKAAISHRKKAANNKQIIFNTYAQLYQKNKGQVKQKDLIQITGLSERTIRKYWKELKAKYQ